MYANLKVEIVRRDGTSETMSGWKIVVADGKTIVYLDAQDGTGNYAEPDGERVIGDLIDMTYESLVIQADF